MKIEILPRNRERLDSLNQTDTFYLDNNVYMICELGSITLEYKGHASGIIVVNLRSGNIIVLPASQLVIPVTAELTCHEV